MASLHLSLGSAEPPKVEGKVRLYSMKFCPFAHRVRLVLSYKNIPHEIVNINLKNKPDWYLNINPQGKVPALVNIDGDVVLDSIPIINFLDEQYPQPPLYNQSTMARDLELAENYENVVRVFSSCIHKKDTRPLSESVQEICDYLLEFETELNIRQTPFFAGDQPGYLDIIMWPFVERAKALTILYNEPVEFDKEKFPKILKWICSMKKQKFVEENADSHEIFAKVVKASNEGTIDYDNIE